MKAKLAVAAGVAVVLAGAAWLVIDRASSPVRSPEEHASPAALLAATVQPETPPEGAAPAITERADAPKASVERVLVWGELHGGAGLPDGMIELFDELERPYTAAVGANATWSIFGISPGRYRICTRFAGYVPLDEQLLLGGELDRVRHDLTLVRSAVIPVRFVSRVDGKDLDRHDLSARSLSVIATLEKPGARIPGVVDHVVMSFEAGQFHSAIDGDMVPQGAHGSLEVIAPLPVWASCVLRSEVLESRWLRGGEAELVFELDPAEIESRLGALVVECVDGRTGERLEEARVHTSFRSGGGRNDSRRGADGRLTLTRLAPGMQMLELGADDFAADQRWIRILPGETLDLGTIALFPATRLDGRVVDPDGKGVAATIAAIPHRRVSVRCLDLQRRWSSNANGVFAQMEVEPGMVRLIAQSPDWGIAAVDVDTTRDEPVEIRLEHGTDVALRVAPGGPPSVDVSLLDSAGQPLWFGRIVMTRLKLKPGRYELCTVVDENIVERRNLDVSDKPLVVDVGGSR